MSRFRYVLAAALIVALLATVALAGGCKKDAPPAAETPDEAAETPTDNSGGASTDDAATPPVTDPVDPSTDDGSSTEAPVSNPPSTITLRLYWVSAGENALGVERTVPYTRAVATVAMTELLAGPTAAEKTIWPAIDTAIPAGTKLLGVTVANRVAKVDLSGEFASGGGTFSVTARLAQVVYTLTQFPTVDAVEFYLNGARVDVFSSEGLILDGPQRLEDYDALLPIDA